MSPCLCLFFVVFRGQIFGIDASKGGCKLNQSLKYRLLREFLPSHVELNGLRVPFKLFEACQVYQQVYNQYIEEILVNKCKNYMITGITNENKAPYPITARGAFDLVQACTKWEAFGNYRNKREIKVDVEKLLYQLNTNQVEKWNVSLLDRLIRETKMNQDYGEYLRSTKRFRFLLSTKIEFAGQLIYTLDMAKDVDFNQSELNEIQIYEINISVNKNDEKQQDEVDANSEDEKEEKLEQKEDEEMKQFIELIYFNQVAKMTEDEKYDRDLDDYEMDDNDITLYQKKEEEKNETKVIILEDNIGLACFNYHLLHYLNSSKLPIIKIKCNVKCDLSVYLKYIKSNELSKQEKRVMQLIQHEREILNKVFDHLEFKDDKEGLTKEEFEKFWHQMPTSYNERWRKTGFTFEDIAGDDGVLDYSEFAEMCDKFAEQEGIAGGSHN